MFSRAAISFSAPATSSAWGPALELARPRDDRHRQIIAEFDRSDSDHRCCFGVGVQARFPLICGTDHAGPQAAANAFYTSTGSSSSAGSTAYADWSAGKQIVLSKQLGNAIASAGLSAQSGGITTWTVGQVGGHETHTLGLEEIPNHTHNAYGTPAGGNFIYGVSTGGTNANVGAGTTAFEALTTGNISTYTSQTALSLVQGTTFYNVLLKL